MKVITTNLLNRFWTNGVKPLKEKVDSMATNFKTANNLTKNSIWFCIRCPSRSSYSAKV